MKMTFAQIKAELEAKANDPKFLNNAAKIYKLLNWTWQGVLPDANAIYGTAMHVIRSLPVVDEGYTMAGTGGIVASYVHWPNSGTEVSLYIKINPEIHDNLPN